MENNFRLRLASLRKKRNLTQKNLASLLSISMGRAIPLATSTISAWELGRKYPSYDLLVALADFFGVSTDFLLGKTSYAEPVEKKHYYMDDFIIDINENELKKYIGKPVYIVFKDDYTLNRWGIYNAKENCFNCEDARIKCVPDKMKFYATTPETEPVFRAKKQRLDATEFSKATLFWVEYQSPDNTLRTRFSGWYHHNNAHDAIINDKGDILSYSGFDVSYFVYKNKI